MEAFGKVRGSPILSPLLAFLFISQARSSCLPEPIDLRIGNVTLENYGNNAVRGVDISLGSPQQSFAFTPQMPLNDTFVFWKDDGFCSDSFSTDACATFRGGLYDNKSTSLDPAFPDSSTNIGSGYPPSQFVLDEMTLNDNTSLASFSFGIAQKDAGQQGYHPQAGLGLGPDSTLLNYLKKKNLISSRTWGYFWGLDGGTEDSQMDGSIVLGGYDSAKVSGANYTQDLQYTTSSCLTGMIAVLTDISLNFRNGSSQSIFGGISSAALNTCIDPDYPALMTIPYDPYFTNFEEESGEDFFGRAFGIHYYVMRYMSNEDLYDGDLTLTMSNGLSVRIPNDQLVVPDVVIDENSGAVIYNYTDPDLLLLSLQSTNSDDMTRIGRYFFTSAYLMVNHDTSQYTLWQANATTDKAIVSVDGNNQVQKELCTADAAESPSTTAPSSSSATVTSSSTSKSGLSSGAIAGIAVGGVAGAALVIGALFFLLRKKKVQEAPAAGYGGYAAVVPMSESISRSSNFGELAGAQPHNPHELAGTHTQHELPAHERRRQTLNELQA